MLGIILLSLFILFILAIVIFEIRNERQYRAQRRQRNRKKSNDTPASKTHDAEEAVTEIVKEEIPKETKKLPKCIYPLFSHTRLIEMGLSDEEANEFVQELIPQLETQIPLIEEAFQNKNFHQMERLTHSIKGSATNLGTGGISDLLVEYNNYLKTGSDFDIAKVYLDSLKHYTQTLKAQYS